MNTQNQPSQTRRGTASVAGSSQTSKHPRGTPQSLTEAYSAPRLFHYTCGHAAPSIERDGLIFPNLQSPVGPLAWFTDLDAPVRDALGLTSRILSCDRTEYRFEVDPADVVPWVKVRRDYPLHILLEAAPGAMPMHWYVSAVPVRVLS